MLSLEIVHQLWKSCSFKCMCSPGLQEFISVISTVLITPATFILNSLGFWILICSLGIPCIVRRMINLVDTVPTYSNSWVSQVILKWSWDHNFCWYCRYRCKRYEQDITQLKSTRTSTAEQERGLAEVMQLNNSLQLRLQNAEESDQVLIEQKIIYCHSIVSFADLVSSILEQL